MAHSAGLVRPGYVCADCGSPGKLILTSKCRKKIEIIFPISSDPTWSSINRFVLICSECVLVHRSLGRNVSQVKSLSDPLSWSPTLIELLYELYSSGSNSVWEHTLLDPPNLTPSHHGLRKGSTTGTIPRKKPSFKDVTVTTREEFIKAKYASLSYVNKPSTGGEGDLDNDIEDWSDQLHSSVRTPNLKVSLRLLAAGADPNYIHPEKGTTPLHVASHSGQILQIELLLTWGADPLIRDTRGLLPLDISSNQFISDRLRAAPYIVTDRLSMFVWGKKGNHETGPHIVTGHEVSIHSHNPLGGLSDSAFAELVKDVFDEVDRRELNQAMSSLKAMTIVPFLPVNSLFSSTRNQSRQKLATLLRHEFNCLITDILRECCLRMEEPSAPANHDNNGVDGISHCRTYETLAEEY